MFKKLLETLQEKGITKRQLALKSNIIPIHLYNAINGVSPFYPKYRKLISEFLNLPEQELFPDYFAKGGNKNAI